MQVVTHEKTRGFRWGDMEVWFHEPDARWWCSRCCQASCPHISQLHALMHLQEQATYHIPSLVRARVHQWIDAWSDMGGALCPICLRGLDCPFDVCSCTQCGQRTHSECLNTWWTHRPLRLFRCVVCQTGVT